MNLNKLSVIIPVYNEKKTILEILKRVDSVKLPLEKEIIIVDDCSTDGTREILKKLDKGYKIFFKEKNEGKGSALRKGLAAASGEVVIIQDADLEYDPSQYPQLIDPILKGKSEVVYGSRNLTKNPRFKKSYYWGVRFLSFLINFIYGSHLTDVYTCYKVFKKSIIDDLNLESNGFEIEIELTAKILKKNCQIIEVPINYSPRGFKEGKKINWSDGLKALWAILKYY